MITLVAGDAEMSLNFVPFLLLPTLCIFYYCRDHPAARAMDGPCWKIVPVKPICTVVFGDPTKTILMLSKKRAYAWQMQGGSSSTEVSMLDQPTTDAMLGTGKV